MDNPGNTRGENAVALIVLHMKEQTGQVPTNDEVTQFIVHNDLLGNVMTMDWEEVEKKLQTIKEKGENDANS